MKWPEYTASCRKDIDAVLKSGAVSAYRSNKQWGVGPKEGSNVYRFERELEKAWNVKHCVAMNSGTMALVAAIKALELPPGSEILTTPFSFSATPASILIAGHTPRFADISPDHFCLDPESVKKSITKKTKAILNVDLFGYLPDYSELLEIDLPVIQDNCQSAGAVRDGKRLHGVIAIGSGNGSKNLPVIEGGWAYTNDGKYADRMRHYISHGENFDKLEVGVNGRMHELCAILARHGLKDLDERNNRRRQLAYAIPGYGMFPDADLKRMREWPWGEPPIQISVASDAHVHYVTALRLRKDIDRARFIKRMARHGITVGAGYIQPTLDKYPAFKKYVTHPLPVAHELSFKTLALLYCLTPEKPLSYAKKVAGAIRASLD